MSANIEITRFPRIVTTDSQDNSNISGGSSDFAIAKVEVTVEEGLEVPYTIMYVDGDPGVIIDTILESMTYDVVLYKGLAVSFKNDTFTGSIVATGDIEVSDTGLIRITGDGTLSFTSGDA